MEANALMVLAAAWRTAKENEKAANTRRLEIEAAIVAAMPARTEGTESMMTDGFKIKVTYKVNRSIDAKAVAALTSEWDGLPPVVQAAFRWKPEVAVTQLKALQTANPEQYAIAAMYVTTAPAKTAVEVEAL